MFHQNHRFRIIHKNNHSTIIFKTATKWENLGDIMTIKPYQADLLLLLTAISWGTTFLLVQDAVQDVPVYTFLFWRFGLAFLLMLLIAIRHLPRLDRATLTAAALLGLLNLGAYALQTFGLTLTLSSSVAFITGLFVVLVPIVAFFLMRQPVARSVWVGSIVALIGLWLLTTQGRLSAGWGELYTFGCAILFALHILYTDRYARRYDVVLLVTFQFGMMGVGSGLLGWIYGDSLLPPAFTFSFVLGLVITIVFATIFAFWVQTSMQRYTTPSRAALIFTMEPLSAAIFGYFYGGEVLGILQLVGGGMIVAGMVFAEVVSW
jgi:drug/metabolite transporter (DMT)-like permease